MNYFPYEYKALHDVKKKNPSLTLSKSRMWGKFLETRLFCFFFYNWTSTFSTTFHEKHNQTYSNLYQLHQKLIV